MTSIFEKYGKKGVVQIGTHVLHVVYYFAEEDMIYCKVVNGDSEFNEGDTFFTHYKSLLE
jgi:hypothetical protein